MPSKLRKAIGAVKDQTSISLAKASPTSNLEVAILKATTHEEIPVEDRYINEILLLTSSNKVYATISAHALAKRISRTRNWVVALKSLMIILRLFQDGDPYFPKDVHLIMNHGGRILNLNSFRDDYNSSPWDYTAYVRTVALYLNERLQCIITGKLQRRMVNRDQFRYHPHDTQRYNEHVRDMKPAVLIEKIKGWQGLLARAIATRPTGVAKNNRIVQISLYAIVRESFDVYRDISDGVALILDNFFQIPSKICVSAFEACNTSVKQVDELRSFYAACQEIGVGRTSEYPSVQKISEELMDMLREYVKDNADFPDKPQTSPQLRLPQHGRQRGMSLEDLISVTEPGTIPSFSFERGTVKLQSSSSVEDFQSVDTASMDQNSECPGKPSSVDDMLSMHTAGTSPARSIDQQNMHTAGTSPARSINQQNNSMIDLLSFDDPVPTQSQFDVNVNEPSDEWELVLAETASNISSTQNAIAYESLLPDDLQSQASTSYNQSNTNNPFLTLGNELSIFSSSPAAGSFSTLPTFQAAPTFRAQNPNEIIENDIFSSPRHAVQMSSQGSLNQPHLMFEQQMWLQNQNQIIAKHIS